MELKEMAVRMIALRASKAALDEQSKGLGAEMKELEKEMFEAMSLAELDKVSIEGHTFTPKIKMCGSIPAAVQDKAIRAFCRKNLGGLIKKSIHSSTLNAWLREQMDGEDELPKWAVKYIKLYAKREVSIRKG